jgi:hypothetical protein
MEAVITQTPTADLSDAQLVILSTAAQRADGSLLPFPQSLSAKGAALNKVVDMLCKRKLADERQTIKGAPEWRRGEDGQSLGLFITNGGLLALGIEDTERERPSQVAASMPPIIARQQPRSCAVRLGRHHPPTLGGAQHLRKANRTL